MAETLVQKALLSRQDAGGSTVLAALSGPDRTGRVFLASSAAVYGRQSGLLTEETPLMPLSAYAEAPMGPQTMVRRMMKATPARNEQEEADYAVTKRTIKALTERAVGPGFDEFLQQRKDLEPTH